MIHNSGTSSSATADHGTSSRLLRQVAIGAFLFIAGTALGVFLASIPVRSRTSLGGSFPNDFLRLVGIGSLTWYACLLSSPLYIWLARHYPVFQKRWKRNLAIHFLVTTALVVVTGLVFFQLMMRQGAGVRTPDLSGFLMLRFLTESLPFWSMIALIHAVEFHRRYRFGEVQTAQLQTQLAESRLEALRAQLRPHFLFNTLQGISTLMHRDVKAADAMLSRLSDLLRQTLQRGERQEAPLREEMEMLGHYVEICRERFRDRLVFDADVSPEAANALVPFFILQPLVENALQHGIARRAGIGRVRVTAKRQGEVLYLDVTDDGPGLAAAGEDPSPREGIGLSNTRQRLNQLYGDAQKLTLAAAPAGGLRVELIIPYRSAPYEN